MTLLDECLESLQGNYKVLSDNQGEQLLEELFEVFPLTDWGRLDWNRLKIASKCTYNENFIDSINKFFGNHKSDVTIVWDEVNHPVITSKLSSILDVIDDVTAVSSNTWIFSKDKMKVVEFYHDGEITLGIINN
ncbi:hypothetical protein HZI73_00535 [Vallitalea pronyensis]|uniref:Uncharacterized protein n=1 Tax=Vallitalea pronyensis TaxID=1348613 RepID=A0A8J8MFV4_9FIRM|nr:hypothetical protein [Vallitalea pronyensis]QUI20885.1 hypothetical protein HZI73_00535 [Vallitalea pronyensis]